MQHKCMIVTFSEYIWLSTRILKHTKIIICNVLLV